jgi:hypothetical protein
MQKTIIILLITIPSLGFSQFGVSEYYLSAKFGLGMGMNSYTYQSVQNGTSQDHPKFIQLDLGSGFAPEIALGLKLTRDVYVETSVSYVLNTNFYMTKSGSENIEQGYSFNRFNIKLNGKYYVEINQTFMLDFSAGISYSIPEELIVKIGLETEQIHYAGSVGFQAAFGGNYVVHDITFSGGIRYRLERFSIKPNQDLPLDFKTINPSFSNISSSGIDVLLGAQYNF